MVNAMEVHQIRYFQAVAECRSFTRAARREHVSQPTLSHQISKLESELGAKLLHRTGRSVRLTGFGEAFLPEADAILRHIQQARTSIRELLGVAGGRVTLGVIPTIAPFFLPMPLKEFARQHNQIEVRVVEEASGALLQSLREGSIDMAIMPLPVDGKWAYSSDLIREKLYAVVSADHPLRAEKHVTLKQLCGAPFLFLKDGHCFREDALAAFRRARVEPRITFESGCFLTILNMVKAGIGISVMPEMALDETSGCKFIPIRSDRPIRTIGLVQSNQRAPTRAQALLAEFLKKSAETALNQERR
jgi:LysR family hydrogen peroxide-inducible transcriptional activator